MGISILAWLSSLDPYWGLGMITRPIWKCPCINLYLVKTYICMYLLFNMYFRVAYVFLYKLCFKLQHMHSMVDYVFVWHMYFICVACVLFLAMQDRNDVFVPLLGQIEDQLKSADTQHSSNNTAVHGKHAEMFLYAIFVNTFELPLQDIYTFLIIFQQICIHLYIESGQFLRHQSDTG